MSTASSTSSAQARAIPDCSPAAAPSCSRAPTSSPTTGSSNPDLLKLAPQAELIDVGKRPGQSAEGQQRINELLIETARNGTHRSSG